MLSILQSISYFKKINTELYLIIHALVVHSSSLE